MSSVQKNEATDEFAGVVATACGHREHTKHGKPVVAMREHQPDAREGIGRAATGVGEAHSTVEAE
jgi:hypothetical protein